MVKPVVLAADLSRLVVHQEAASLEMKAEPDLLIPAVLHRPKVGEIYAGVIFLIQVSQLYVQG